MAVLNARVYPHIPADILDALEKRRVASTEALTRWYAMTASTMDSRLDRGVSTVHEERDGLQKEMRIDAISPDNPYGFVDPDTGRPIDQEC